jgi:hypothetical protein
MPIRAIAIAFVLWALAGAGAYACEGQNVLYEDSFDTLDPTWGDADDALYVADGRLIITPGLDEFVSDLNNAGFYDDIDYCVRVISVSADPEGNSFAGVLFWAVDYDNYYCALIAGDGAMGIFRRQRGKMLQQVAWTHFDAIRTGKDAVNDLRVVTVGGQVSIYANGELFRKLNGQAPPNGQQIGLRATSAKNLRAVYAFDDLKVVEPPRVKSN